MDASQQTVLRRWIDELHPLRTVLVGDAAEPIVGPLAARIARHTDWALHLPSAFRPTVDAVPNAEGISATYDLAIFSTALRQRSFAAAYAQVSRLRQQARFVACAVPLAGPGAWQKADWQQFEPLGLHQHADTLLCLIRGGRCLSELPIDEPRIWYLAPNRQVFGGVKILYNHVAILNELGIPAVLGTESDWNWPAQWFAWPPGELVFGTNAPNTVRPIDTVVIPEFRYRDAKRYRHAARRLLFVQNQGLATGHRAWRRLGYDSILTLGKPDGTPSFLEAFLAPISGRLPIFSVPNHFDDDPWGQTTAPRVPGRILCLPRKGPEFVRRLQQEFGAAVAVADNLPQTAMAVEMARADVYAHTGFPEGLGMPIVEAMLSGAIACGFAGGGGLDVMRDNATAYVAPDGDADALVASVRRALGASHREEIRIAGTHAARRFTRAAAGARLHASFAAGIPSFHQHPRRVAEAARSQSALLELRAGSPPPAS